MVGFQKQPQLSHGTLSQSYSGPGEMQKKLSISTATRITPKQNSSLSRYFRLPYNRSLVSRRHHSFTNVNVNVCRPTGSALSPANRRVSKCSMRQAIHDVRDFGTGPADERRPRFASPTTEMGNTDYGQISSRQDVKMHRAMIALGSNLGDRVSMIEQACEKMPARGINVKATSLLYETAPMYVADQGSFYNGVCEVGTILSPHQLLDALQAIENDLGRIRIIDKGPRNIDLDIVMYDDQTIRDDRLHIPHKLMLEREFVLRPLADLIPNERLPPPHDSHTIAGHLAALDKKAGNGRPLPVTQLAPNLPPIKASDSERETLVMAILNVTPDSFSDGNVHKSCDENALESTIRDFISSGASVIDVGGQSTRPNAKRLSPNEELARVLPAIRLIHNLRQGRNIAISIDTFYGTVAKAAIEAGADIVNDVSAGTLDPEMLHTVAKLHKTIILMHMRGDPSTMNSMTSYPQGVVHGVGQELLDRVKAAEAAGIARWRIILDPGVGFAKTQAQNLELLRRLDDLRNFPGLQGMPWLIGTSRKGFIGKITGVKQPSQRIWGTAAAVTASIQGGADIVRVHDVAEMHSVVRMADAIFRVKPDGRSGDGRS